MTRRRWECPAGAHAAVLGPTRPRRDDTCRYCWPCSEAKGRLVERVCPALEKRRAAKGERVAARTAAARDRRRAEASAYPNVLRGVFHAWCKLSIWGTDMSNIELVIRRRRPGRVLVLREEVAPGKFVCHQPGHPDAKGEPVYATASYSTGHAWGGRRIAITAGTDVGEAYGTLCHELAHIANHRKNGWRQRPGERREPHGDTFRSILVAATERITGLQPVFAGHTKGAIQRGVDDAFRKWLAQEAVS